MQTVTLLPISDVGPNDGSASPPAPHYQNLDDEPNDGDGTFVSLSFAGKMEVCLLDVSNIPEGSTVLAFRIRWAAKVGAAVAQGRAGVRIDGTYYFASPRVLLSSYPNFDETVTHPDGQPWTRARIATAFAALELFSIEDDTMLPRPRFTELIGLADIIRPGHPDAGGSSRAARSSSASQAPRSSSRPQAPGASMASQAARSGITSRASRAGAVSQAPMRTVSPQMARAVTPADLPKLRLRFASQSPRASISGQGAHAAIAGQGAQGREE